MQYPPQQPYQPSQQSWPPPSQYPQVSPWQQPSQYPQQQWQQPYPPQQLYYPPPMMQPTPMPPKKRRTWVWVLLAVGITLIIFGAIGSHGSSQTSTANTVPATSNTQSNVPTQVATQAPTRAPVWTTIKSYKGSGIKKTSIFTVPDDWKILWTCNPASFLNGQYNVQVYVYGSDGTLQDVAINELCQHGTTNRETEEHTGGDIYLEINSEADWTVKIQVLQ
jgi:hypothetical protein